MTLLCYCRNAPTLGVDVAGEQRLQRCTAAHAHFVRFYRTLDRVRKEFYSDDAVQARAAALESLFEAYFSDRRIT
jgi:hypothetical protein